MKLNQKKIPGFLPPLPKSEIDGKIKELSTKSLPELFELRDRQKKLVDNKSFLSKLPDKGEKIKLLYDKIIQEIQNKKNENDACQLINNMKLSSKEDDKKLIQHFEWDHKNPSNYLDSDDESEPENVLQILSQSTAHNRKTKVEKPQKPLITTADILEINEVPHVKYIVNKTENQSPSYTKQFKPYKTTSSNVHDPEKESLRKKHKNWEVTAATPPPIVHEPTKVLTIEESLKLLQQQSLHIKEVEAKHAAARLISRLDVKVGSLPSDAMKFGGYREEDNQASDDSDDESSDKEVHDEEPERGGVVFTIMN